MTSDGGALLLGEVDRCGGLVRGFAGCFSDRRDPRRCEHSVEQLLRQRIFGLALGYEDLVDHDDLRRDALLATVVGYDDATGAHRRRASDRGAGLAGKSTLNRLEWGVFGEPHRYRRIEVDAEAVDRYFVEVFQDSYPQPPAEIVLDLDTTDIELHGDQEGRFFHGYYDHHCYLPLYIFCGEHLLLMRLRTANRGAAEGCVEELTRIVAQIRERWPRTRIVLRGDSGFSNEPLMSWCEQNRVHYVLGMARNSRLEKALAPALDKAHRRCERSGKPARIFAEWPYQTLDSWSRERRVIGKAEITLKGENPRFIVTSLARRQAPRRRLYEQVYCARGEMENRIKEQQLDLFASRTSAHRLKVNQMRLWLAGVAYTLLVQLRRLGLAGTDFARARASTIRLKLLKIGGLVKVTVRKIWVHLATGCPYQAAFAQCVHQLQRAGPTRA
jgi:hypothetical protein